MILPANKIFAYFAKLKKIGEKCKYNISYYSNYNSSTGKQKVRRGFAYNEKSESFFLNSLFKEMETFLNRDTMVEQYKPNTKDYDQDVVLIYNNQLIITNQKINKDEGIDGKYTVLTMPNDQNNYLTSPPKLPYFSIASLNKYVLDQLPSNRTIIKDPKDITNWKRINEEMPNLLYSYRGDSLDVSRKVGEYYRNLIFTDKALYSSDVTGQFGKNVIVKKWIFLNSSFSTSDYIRVEFWNRFPEDAKINICNRYLFDSNKNLQSIKDITSYRWKFQKNADAILITHHYDNVFSVSGIEKLIPKPAPVSVSPNRNIDVYVTFDSRRLTILALDKPVSTTRKWEYVNKLYVSYIEMEDFPDMYAGYKSGSDYIIFYTIFSIKYKLKYVKFNLESNSIVKGDVEGDVDNIYLGGFFTIQNGYLYAYDGYAEPAYFKISGTNITYIGTPTNPPLVTEYQYYGTDIRQYGWSRHGDTFNYSGNYLITDYVNLKFGSEYVDLELTNIVNFRGGFGFTKGKYYAARRSISPTNLKLGSLKNPDTGDKSRLIVQNGVVIGINPLRNTQMEVGGFKGPESRVYFIYAHISEEWAYFSYPLYSYGERNAYRPLLSHKYAPGLLNMFNYACQENAPWIVNNTMGNPYIVSIDGNLKVEFTIYKSPIDVGAWEVPVIGTEAYMDVNCEWKLKDFSTIFMIIKIE